MKKYRVLKETTHYPYRQEHSKTRDLFFVQEKRWWFDRWTTIRGVFWTEQEARNEVQSFLNRQQVYRTTEVI